MPSITAVITSAPAVAASASPIAAPPAGVAFPKISGRSKGRDRNIK
jgi:hypothetical protein